MREFVAEFRVLSGTAKGKSLCEAVEASGRTLAEFYGEGRGDLERVAALLKAMQGMSRPIKPRDLGTIGRDHLARIVAAAGGDPDSFEHRLGRADSRRRPHLAEVAFAHAPDAVVRTPVYWPEFLGRQSAAIRFIRLGRRKASTVCCPVSRGSGEPVIVCVHVTAPRLDFLDRGKSSVALPREVSG